jgi:hypothetical protein
VVAERVRSGHGYCADYGAARRAGLSIFGRELSGFGKNLTASSAPHGLGRLVHDAIMRATLSSGKRQGTKATPRFPVSRSGFDYRRMCSR